MGVIYVAGHTGLVGSAICRRLEQDGVEPLVVSSENLDLAEQADVRKWFESHNIEQVYVAAAKVGGIGANLSSPATFLHTNLAIQSNVIHEAWRTGVSKLLFLGSSCIYPKLAEQPIRETSLLSGPLEESNEAYAIAKIAGIKMCHAYRSQYGFDAIAAMPTNLYGPGDDFDLETSHVLPALVRKFHDAKHFGSKSVSVWGTGEPRREFLHVDDLADACVFLMHHYSESEIVNIGWGKDISISELAHMISEIVGYDGAIEFDHGKPDGTPRKLLDVGRLESLGWSPSIDLSTGVRDLYDWYQRCGGANP